MAVGRVLNSSYGGDRHVQIPADNLATRIKCVGILMLEGRSCTINCTTARRLKTKQYHEKSRMTEEVEVDQA